MRVTKVRRSSWLAIVATAVILGVLSFPAFSLDNPSAAAFNGKNLTGWHAQGSGNWKVDHGEIVGSVKADSSSGWLLLDHGYEDFMVRLSFRCDNCDAGMVFRSAKADNGTSGTYVSLAGPNIGAVSRLTVDAQGSEVDRKALGALNFGVPQAFDPVQIKLNPDGWNEVEFVVRGDILEGSLNEHNFRPFTIASAKLGQTSHYGVVGLRVSGSVGAELRIKDISVENLTQRPALPAEITGDHFRERKLSDLFYSEGIAAGDVNRDGVQDVVAGPFYYLGPDYTVAHEIYPSATTNPSVKNATTDADSMYNYVYDFNGDGWPDVLEIDPLTHVASLYINPRGESRHWDAYKVVTGIASETTQLTDIDGDGRPELMMSQGRAADNQICYAKPDPSDPTKPWTIHLVSEKGARGPHGMGVGDVNGDGRMDILQASGWWEQPAAGSTDLWKFHPVPEFGGGPWTAMERPFAGGAEMFVYDVNGDGLPDVITSLGSHGWGLAWLEQKKDSQGVVSWMPHMIMGNPYSAPDVIQKWEETDKSVAFSELHALAVADMDGDGLQDIIAGKRRWSHGDNYGSPDAMAAPVVYWFKLVRKPGGQVEFVPHLVNNNSGVGDQIQAVDINGDGKPDVLTSSRKGTFIFFNNLPNRH
jgi:hypothetical protein